MVHELKVNQQYWPDYKSGLKNNSLRKNDRNFAVGDVCVFRLWLDAKEPENSHFVLNEMIVKKITHILHDYDSRNLKAGYCILSLKNV